MDRSYIARHDVIERYLLGKLSEEEAAAFEDRFVFDKELLDEIELTEQMINGLRSQPENPGAARSAASPGNGESRGRFEWAIAAFLAAFAVLLPFMYFSPDESSPAFEISASLSDTHREALVILERPRGASSMPMTRVSIESGPDAVVVLGVPVNNRLDTADLSVTLLSGDTQLWTRRWTGGVDDERCLYLSIPAARLGNQDYSLKVGDGPDSETFRFNAYRRL